MKLLKANITTILIIAVAVLVTLLLVGMFRKTPVPDTHYEERLADRDAVIKAKEETITVLSKANTDKDKSIQANERADSLLVVALSNNKTKYVANDKKLSQVHTDVANLDKEQLRAELARYTVSPN